MKRLIFLSAIFTSVPTVFAQITTSKNPAKNIAVIVDSTKTRNERQQALSPYRATAIKDKKKILIFPPSEKAARQQDVVYIAKLEKKEVYLVDLSTVVSKYIHETEKNLSRPSPLCCERHGGIGECQCS